MRIEFFIKFHTKINQSLYISGNTQLLGENDFTKALLMKYYNNDYWHINLEDEAKNFEDLEYKYLLKNEEGELIAEFENSRSISISKNEKEIIVSDTWNNAGDYENAFYTSPFQETLLQADETKIKSKQAKDFTHQFKVKSPLLAKSQVMCLVGSSILLGNWSTTDPLLMNKDGEWWTVKTILQNDHVPFSYKYGVYDIKAKTFIRFENGVNRSLPVQIEEKKITIIHDGFAYLPNNTWRGAGIAIPVFSLRSKNSFGVGEFSDLNLLVDWAKNIGLKIIQILPVNDTTATHTFTDSYPYASISAFALHPMYINLQKVAGKKHGSKISSLKKKQKQLNDLPEVDYTSVNKYKNEVLQELYELDARDCFDGDDYKAFFEKNQHWLVPYAVFCYLRDKNGTSHFQEWKTNGVYDKTEVERLSSKKSKAYKSVALHFFIQFHLHLQLKEAADYARKKGLELKGDIPIGVYRYGCDAWIAPELYHMEMQAGAPPDDFAVKGQNWGFPTYNWKKMQEDNFSWWRQRFEQMSEYFGAFRIDHILGFFRIWSIPMNSVEGIMGHFVPAIPVHIIEFSQKNIWFDYQRYCRPFVNDEILGSTFGSLTDKVKTTFFIANDRGGYDLEMQFSTQRQVEDYFASMEPSEDNKTIKHGLFDLISNVLFFEEEFSQGTLFHFRISMETTSSFRYLDDYLKQQLKDLYVNYFYDRQDAFWKKEAMHKLPYLKASTNMLICGEDLGMVPHSVPEVMNQLGILSLEIQRMPKSTKKEFFHPNDAPYLSVITPSTHDMSTIRGWWEEDREKTQRFFNNELGQAGASPYFCEPWINRAIILQHLYSPAMWSIFQLQDLMGLDEKLRRPDPHAERINIPADPKHYWRYRMHIPLEQLAKEKVFNMELKEYISNSGR